MGKRLRIIILKVVHNDRPFADGRYRAITYGTDNSLNVNWNADNGLNVNNYDRTNRNWNLGALPRKSPFYLNDFSHPPSIRPIS